MTETPPRFVVHTAAHMAAVFRASAERGLTLVAESAEGAASSLGAGVFLAMADDARARHEGASVTVVLDCADDVTQALNAIRLGAPVIRVGLPPAVAAEALARLSGMAARAGVTVETSAPETPPHRAATDLEGTKDPMASVLAGLDARKG